MLAAPSPSRPPAAVRIALTVLVLLACQCGRPGEAPTGTVTVDPGALAFFNRLSGRLEIELSDPPERIAPNLRNERATPAARITSLRLPSPRLFEDGDFHEVSEADLRRVVLRAPRIRLSGEAGLAVEHAAPDGACFTVEDLWRAVEATEQLTREQTAWFGGIDVHHVYFEGIREQEDGTWAISWGS